MTFQTAWFGFGQYSPNLLEYHSWINNPSNHKIAYVAAQAKIVFDTKKEFVGKGDVSAEFDKVQKSIPFDSTGHILSIAVIATDVYKRKALKGRNPSAAKDASLELLKGVLHQENTYQANKQIWNGFSPTAFLSPANLTEIGLLLLVEDKIMNQYREEVKNKLISIITRMEQRAVKEKYGKDYLKELSYYRSEVVKI